MIVNNWDDEDYCEKMVSQDGLLLKYIEKQTFHICELAVFQNSNAINYVKDPMDFFHKMGLKIVAFDPMLLEGVKYQTEDIIKVAIIRNH